MIVDRMRERDRDFPRFADPEAVTAARFWHCAYRTFAPIEELSRLEVLVIATYPDADLGPLGALTALRYLRVLHPPKIHDLGPLSGLRRLETLRLESTPGWDSSGKFVRVASLAPLAELPALRHLELFGVRPPDASLAGLEASRSLRSVRVSKFRAAEIARFHTVTGVTDAFAPGPGVADWD